MVWLTVAYEPPARNLDYIKQRLQSKGHLFVNIVLKVELEYLIIEVLLLSLLNLNSILFLSQSVCPSCVRDFFLSSDRRIIIQVTVVVSRMMIMLLLQFIVP
jgi:hypothetical protein